jgi:hypothetical protein
MMKAFIPFVAILIILLAFLKSVETPSPYTDEEILSKGLGKIDAKTGEVELFKR